MNKNTTLNNCISLQCCQSIFWYLQCTAESTKKCIVQFSCWQIDPIKIAQQVRLVQLGALAPLIAMAEMETQPQHFAGHALLKLADNFENHARIAEEGGIETLLWLGRSRNTHQELQYKAARTVIYFTLREGK